MNDKKNKIVETEEEIHSGNIHDEINVIGTQTTEE